MGIFNFFRKEKSTQDVFISDKADYHWESAVEEYCKIHGKKKADLNFDDMDETEEAVIWEYAGNHIAFFLTWIIQNDFYDAEEFEAEEIQLLKEEEISGMDFLMEYCDGKFVRQFMNAEILDFVDSYYDTDYFEDYCSFIEEEIKGTVLGITFSWDIYHRFAPVLNQAYRAHKERNI